MNDPEGCDRLSEKAKLAGSAFVVDGELFCATDDGDCELAPTRVIVNRTSQSPVGAKISVHILRKEAAAHSDELHAKNEIAFCYSADLWYPSEGRYRGRFYLNQDAEGRFVTAFYPRTRDI